VRLCAGAERSQALAEAAPPALRIPRLVTGEAEAAAAFLRDALTRGHEGVVVVKSLEAATS